MKHFPARHLHRSGKLIAITWKIKSRLFIPTIESALQVAIREPLLQEGVKTNPSQLISLPTSPEQQTKKRSAFSSIEAPLDRAIDRLIVRRPPLKQGGRGANRHELPPPNRDRAPCDDSYTFNNSCQLLSPLMI